MTSTSMKYVKVYFWQNTHTFWKQKMNPMVAESHWVKCKSNQSHFIRDSLAELTVICVITGHWSKTTH